MITTIPVSAQPNQSRLVRLDNRMYSIEILTLRDSLYITLIVDGETIIRNRALRTFAPIEGNLLLLDMQGTSEANWQELGSRFILVYVHET